MKIKSAKSYNSKLGTIFVAYGLIWLIVTALIIQNIESKISFHPAWVGLCTFVVIIIFLVRAFKKHFEPFRCPDCGEIIEKSLENSNASNEAIIYHCKKCEVLWHVGDTPSPG